MTQVILGPDLNKIQYYGEAGNASVFDGYYKQTAESTGTDTQVDLFTIPAGAKLNRFCATWTAHGTNGTVKFGWRYKSGATGGASDAFKGATSDAAAGSASYYYIPSSLTALGSSGNATGTFDADIVVYATFATTKVPANYELYTFAEGSFMGTR